MGKKKSTRPRQRFLNDDVKPPHHADIETAAESYVDVRDKRIALLADEKVAKDDLANAMKSHKLELYKCVDSNLQVSLTETVENVKVKVLKDGDESE